MKSFIATALVALGLITGAVAAQAATDELPGYPDWAKRAFDNKG
jgi:opacity protein-like surface antigen